jgi:hypothetical protein
VPICNENTGGATGWCLEAHDLAASKLVAGRPRDLDFVTVLVRERMVDRPVLRERVEGLELSAGNIDTVRHRLAMVTSRAD